MPFLSLITFITTSQCNNTLELKLYLSNFRRGIEKQKEGYLCTNITLIFTRPADLFFNTLFLIDFLADCLSVNNLIDREAK